MKVEFAVICSPNFEMSIYKGDFLSVKQDISIVQQRDVKSFTCHLAFFPAFFLCSKD